MGRYSVSMWSSFCLTYKHLSNGLHKAKHLEMVFHSSRTSGSADSAEYCWDHMVWKTLFCLIMLMILLVIFIFTLLVTHETAIIIARERIFFFLKYFALKFFGNWCVSGFLSGNASCYCRPWGLSWLIADKIRGSKS